MTPPSWRVVFGVAAAFNLAIGASFILAAPMVYRLAGAPPPPTSLEPQMVGWCIATFALGYALVAAAPDRNRDIVRMGVAGKLGVVALVWLHYVAGTAPRLFALLAAGDLAWVAVFIVYLRANRRRYEPDTARESQRESARRLARMGGGWRRARFPGWPPAPAVGGMKANRVATPHRSLTT